MTLREILDFVNFNANKSQEGNSMSADEFNTLINTFNIQMLKTNSQSWKCRPTRRVLAYTIYCILTAH